MEGKGKGKVGKRMSGKDIVTFTMDLSDDEYEELFFGGKGKGRGESKGKRSSGKGAGGQQNPIGRMVASWNATPQDVTARLISKRIFR